MTWIEESLVNHHTHWIHKQNKSKKCCSMLNVLSWLTAIKSHALGVRLTQTNSLLHSHAKAIIPHSYKVLHLFCWFWDRKLLLLLRTYKIILPNVIYSLFPMHSFCTLFNSKNSLSAIRFWWHISCIGPNRSFWIRQVLNFVGYILYMSKAQDSEWV